MKIWWCEEHDPKEVDTTSVACHLGIEQGDTKRCRMVEMRLVSVDALEAVTASIFMQFLSLDEDDTANQRFAAEFTNRLFEVLEDL